LAVYAEQGERFINALTPALRGGAARNAGSMTGKITVPLREGEFPPVDGGTERENLTLLPAQIRELISEQTHETVFDLEVDAAHTFIVEVCATIAALTRIPGDSAPCVQRYLVP